MRGSYGTTTLPERPLPLFISGMPGSGKSTVGAILARILDIPFVDLDEWYEESYGESPAETIRREDERAFRRQEEMLLRQVPARTSVVACGGGTLARNRTLSLALGRGIVVTLDAEVGVLAERLGDASNHPLLAGDKPLAEALAALWQSRRRTYAQGHVQVDTSRRSPYGSAYAVVEALERLGWPERAGVVLKPGFVESPKGTEGHLFLGERSYAVRIVPDLAAGRDFLRQVLGPRRLCLLVDGGVARLHGEALGALVPADTPQVVLPAGEEAKEFDRVPEILERLVSLGVDRTYGVVAIGGGSALDVAGFVASIYMRGLPFVAVPTTLLAAVDAAVGGKNGVNLPHVKNLAGTFRQPSGVLVPVSLVAGEIAARGGVDGAGELLKTGLLRGLSDEELAGQAALLEDLRGGRKGADDPGFMGLLTGALEYKMGVVSRDEFEWLGERTCLNLGHTFAHLMEAASGHALSHGRAVGWGLVVAARLSEQLGVAQEPLVARVTRLAEQFGLWPPPALELSAEALEASLVDKKKRGEELVLVLLKAPGEPVRFPVAWEEAKNLLAAMA